MLQLRTSILQHLFFIMNKINLSYKNQIRTNCVCGDFAPPSSVQTSQNLCQCQCSGKCYYYTCGCELANRVYRVCGGKI